MFDRFEAHFRRDAALSRREDRTQAEQTDDPQLKEFFIRFGGASFNNGLYRVMAGSTLESVRSFVLRAFPAFTSRVAGFGYDWLGRIFALDVARLEGGSPAVLMLEPGTGHALEIPCNLTTFHEVELINFTEEALAVGFYSQWLQRGAAPNHYQCVGYKKPLFLGGKDSLENLDRSDLDVYWTLSAQLIHKTRGLPPGTRVPKIDISD